MVKLSNPGEIDMDNISRPSVDELPPEDRQAYEAFINECEEESKKKRSKKSAGGFCLTSPRIGRVMSLRTRRWSFFQMRMSRPNQMPCKCYNITYYFGANFSIGG
jgi:hypothetical protein